MQKNGFKLVAFFPFNCECSAAAQRLQSFVGNTAAMQYSVCYGMTAAISEQREIIMPTSGSMTKYIFNAFFNFNNDSSHSDYPPSDTL